MKSKSLRYLRIIAVLYTIVVISELSSENTYNYSSLPFILFPLMFLVFLIGFIFSWKWELQAGFIFLLWYAILFTGSVIYFEFRDSGPWKKVWSANISSGIILYKKLSLV